MYVHFTKEAVLNIMVKYKWDQGEWGGGSREN